MPRAYIEPFRNGQPLSHKQDNEIDTTEFATPTNLVLQVTPGTLAGKVQVHGREWKRTKAMVFLPKKEKGFFSCPLNYFQDSCSIPFKWIENDRKERVPLDGINGVARVIVSVKKDKSEERVQLSEHVEKAMFDYFAFNVKRRLDFDCHALICLLANLKLNYLDPPWAFSEDDSQSGEFVMLAANRNLPHSIQHFALCLGKNMYLSKFGKTGQVTLMNLEGMKFLYNCKISFLARPKPGAEPWDGFFART